MSTTISPVSSGSSSTEPPSSVVWKDRSPADRLARAQELLRGTKPQFAELCDLAFALKDIDKRFTHARRLLVRARRHEDYKKQDEKKRRKILQQLALARTKTMICRLSAALHARSTGSSRLRRSRN